MYGVRPQFKYPLYHCIAKEDTIQADVLVNLLSSSELEDILQINKIYRVTPVHYLQKAEKKT